MFIRILATILTIAILLACNNSTEPKDDDINNSSPRWIFDSTPSNWGYFSLYSFDSTKKVCLRVYGEKNSFSTTPIKLNLKENNENFTITIDSFDIETYVGSYIGGNFPTGTPKIVATWNAIGGIATIFKYDTLLPDKSDYGYLLNIEVDSLVLQDSTNNDTVNIPNLYYHLHIPTVISTP